MVTTSGNEGAETAAFRAALRRERIAAREAMAQAEHALASATIADELIAWLMPQSPRSIAFCWPVRKEFDCRPLVTRLLDAGWHACQPVVVHRDAPMEFRAWTPEAPMTKDIYGIPVPATAVVPPPGVVLLPLVAFDKHGFRLGYGGGYFDRTLVLLHPRPLAVGVGFEVGHIDSIGPRSHDIPLDAIATEKGMRHFTTA
jgi:5-formyltetrahydrofolate cyclo-ligase